MTTATRSALASSLRDFHAVNKGGGLFSEATGQWLGAALALTGQRLRLAPTVLTLVNLLIGLATSVTVVVTKLGIVTGT